MSTTQCRKLKPGQDPSKVAMPRAMNGEHGSGQRNRAFTVEVEVANGQGFQQGHKVNSLVMDCKVLSC